MLGSHKNHRTERIRVNPSNIQAVIWDFGGVISSSPFESFRQFERERGLPEDFLRRVNARNHLDNAWARFERNQIDLAAFDEAFALEAAAMGGEVCGREVIALLSGRIRPEMVEALRRLQRRLKIGLITNNVLSPGGNGAEPSGREQILALFHHVIESSRVGLRKPDPAIYRMMCDALAVEPQHCVFLDDLGVNLKPAREMGMLTIKVGEAGPALRQLETLVGFPLGEST